MSKRRASSLILGAMLCTFLSAGMIRAQNIAPSSAVGGGGDDKKAAAKTDPKKGPTTDEQLAILADQLNKLQTVIEAQQQKIESLEKQGTFATTGVVPRIGGATDPGSDDPKPDGRRARPARPTFS